MSARHETHYELELRSTVFVNSAFVEFDILRLKINLGDFFPLFGFQLLEYCKEPVIIEPRCEKSGLRGIRPGLTQTGLYSHRRWLEA